MKVSTKPEQDHKADVLILCGLGRLSKVQKRMSYRQIIVLRIDVKASPFRDSDQIFRVVHTTSSVSETRKIK
jgi:hypothetical protein